MLARLIPVLQRCVDKYVLSVKGKKICKINVKGAPVKKCNTMGVCVCMCGARGAYFACSPLSRRTINTQTARIVLCGTLLIYYTLFKFY